MVISQKLNLAEHCIQTAAQIRLRELLSAIGQQDDPAQSLLQEYDMLKIFLETADFPRLRSERPELAGGSNIEVIVEQTADGFIISPA